MEDSLEITLRRSGGTDPPLGFEQPGNFHCKDSMKGSSSGGGWGFFNAAARGNDS